LWDEGTERGAEREWLGSGYGLDCPCFAMPAVNSPPKMSIALIRYHHQLGYDMYNRDVATGSPDASLLRQ
jgi:hypothetical protein